MIVMKVEEIDCSDCDGDRGRSTEIWWANEVYKRGKKGARVKS